MEQLVLVLTLLGAVFAGRLEHLENEYLPPIGQVRILGTFGPQYSGTPSTQFTGVNRYTGSTQYSQPQQPNAFGTITPQYQQQQGQYSQGPQEGQYYQGRYGGAPTQYSGAASLRADNQPNGGDGSYSYSFETSNGISTQESGTGSVGAQGGYSYTSPEGEVISVRYTADADGFHPEGSHIPGAEAIRKSIEINKAEAASGRYQEGQYREQGYSAQQFDANGSRGQFGQQYSTTGQQYNYPNQQYGTPEGVNQFGVGSRQQYGVSSQQQQFGIGGQQYSTPTQQYGSSRLSQVGVGGQYTQQYPSRSTFGSRQGFGVPAPQYGAPTGPLRTEDSNQGYRY